mmetsp:Transcript_5569/g.18952  ORF Transcript_5569/g.18952 Transcript_5569/m.18952 type:complete len:254 (+) Transcript_5569:731-1492(+)
MAAAIALVDRAAAAKEPDATSQPRMGKSPRPRTARRASAAGLRPVTVAAATSTASAGAASHLLSTIRSACATWRRASKPPAPRDASSSRPRTQSTTQRIESSSTDDSRASSSQNAAATGPGSATPLSSTTIASRGRAARATRSSSAVASSSLTEQQTQPFRSSTMAPSGLRAHAPSETSTLSRPRVSANSFSTTAIRRPWSPASSRRSRVDFPAPRKPHRIVTGTFARPPGPATTGEAPPAYGTNKGAGSSSS